MILTREIWKIENNNKGSLGGKSSTLREKQFLGTFLVGNGSKRERKKIKK